LSPSASSEMQFRSSSGNWKEADDVGWTEISSILTSARTSGSLTLTAGEASGFYTNALTFSGTTAWQGYTYMNEEAEEYTNTSGAPDPVKINAAKLRNYQATYFTTSAELSSTVRPLTGNDIWGASSLNYTVRNLVAKSVFDGTGQDPSWRIDWGRWSKDTLEAHRLNANLDANVMDYRQNVSLSAELPPRDSSMTGNGTFNVWRSTTTVSGRVDDPFETALWRPVTVTETIRLSANSNMRYSMIYEPEEEEVTSLTTGLTYKNLEASFSAAKFVPYILDSTLGWILDPAGEAALHPRDFRLQYRHNLKNDSLFEKRLGYSVDAATNLTLDLQRYTYSALTFSLSTTLRISDFMDATFTTRAENNQIIRYMQDIPYFNLPSLNTSGFENNPFLDLLNSFRFDDTELRRRSGYKLKDFSLVLTHYLGDWNAKLGVRLAPYLDQSVMPYTYKFNTEVSFLIQWIPVSEFKTEVKYDKSVFDIL
ncbi:MAG: LPS-assembly protein LptD, partial [Spirochaetaceae bacterium]|nr:LPS-assembly protein LptD [Spirochaetaceae bacterium]